MLGGIVTFKLVKGTHFSHHFLLSQYVRKFVIKFLLCVPGIVGAPDVGDWAAEVPVPAVGLPSQPAFPSTEEWAIPKMEDWSVDPPTTEAPPETGANWSSPDESWN